MMDEVKHLLLHLRLPFQLMLAPFMLLGALGTGAAPALSWLPPFLAVHVGLYGGATAFNSYYDRDKGPIGFMKRPTPVTARMRTGALLVQGLAVLLLAAGRPAAGVIGLVMLLMGIAYSHPAFRWKASTTGGLLAVALGQGGLAVYLGYYALGGAGLPPPLTHASAAGAALVAMGLYPITQVYQIDEDAARGDRTLPVRLGWRRSLVFSFVMGSVGLIVLAVALAGVLAPEARLLLLGSPVALGAVLAVWAARFESLSPGGNHDWAMGVGLAASAVFWSLLLVTMQASADEPGAFDDPDEPDRPEVRVWKEGEAVEIESTLDVPFLPEQVWPVVLDYDGLADFLPNVDSSRVVARSDSVVRVRQVANVRVVLKKTYHLEMAFTRESDTRVRFRQVDGDLRGYEGYWQVEPIADSAAADLSRITYRGHIATGLGAPWFLGRSVVYRTIREMMPALRREIEARARDDDDG